MNPAGLAAAVGHLEEPRQPAEREAAIRSARRVLAGSYSLEDPRLVARYMLRVLGVEESEIVRR